MATSRVGSERIEIWKMKRLIKELDASRGNRKSLQDAITSVLQKLKLYTQVPTNGLVLYSGSVVTDDGKETKFTLDLVPFKPISQSLYLCDKKFHTEALHELLDSNDNGNSQVVLSKLTVDLPKKHGRGGQSALCFDRLRTESCQNYVRKVAELATKHFIDPRTNLPNVAGLILAGSADFKIELSRSNLFDLRLQAKVLKVVDVSCGRENGFNQAIELSLEMLSNVKFVQEKCLIGKFLEEVSQDSGKFVYGLDDTMKVLEMSAIQTLIIWEDLDINRYMLKNTKTDESIIKHLNKEQEGDQSNFHDSTTSSDLEVQDKKSLLEWFADEHQQFGCSLETVTGNSEEGSHFCIGYGGIGGILRYQLDIRSLDEPEIYEDSE
ncbi:unnamed protein product [Dovyalis caffra]|uniref:eRF1/Pelota-like N-terminal domain-containing protein n=1 Tax=Dovyalis caffra TaxID=77055 RepID=A0AAV1RL14_9ROSI|nr:unnamed protein product [Dovyalis caffra]